MQLLQNANNSVSVFFIHISSIRVGHGLYQRFVWQHEFVRSISKLLWRLLKKQTKINTNYVFFDGRGQFRRALFNTRKFRLADVMCVHCLSAKYNLFEQLWPLGIFIKNELVIYDKNVKRKKVTRPFLSK